MSEPWRTFMLSELACVDSDGFAHPAPAAWVDGQLGDIGLLLNRLAPKYGPEGVLMLDESAARMLALPTEPVARGGIDHPAVQDAARAGWKVKKIGDWSTFKRDDGPAIHLGVAPMLNLRTDNHGVHVEFPLWADSWPDTVAALSLWHKATGVAWHGNPGIAGTAILKEVAPRHGEAGRQPPTWKPKDWGGPDDVAELDFMPGQWSRTPQLPALLGYDWNRAYIGAAVCLEVAPWTLRHTGRIPFDKRRGGWWQVELAPWNVPHMPDPAGYLDEERAKLRWVTTATLDLLETLTAEGVYGGARIVDSWTREVRDWPVKKWGERMRDAYTRAEELSTWGADTVLVRSALKLAGKMAPGMWNTQQQTSWIHRPDWWYSLVAMARCNIWRAAWKEGKASGRWPVMVDRDQVWYESTSTTHEAARPRSYRYDADGTGLQLGHVKPADKRRNSRSTVPVEVSA